MRLTISANGIKLVMALLLVSGGLGATAGCGRPVCTGDACPAVESQESIERRRDRRRPKPEPKATHEDTHRD